jgi:hypothetical protein
VHVEAERHRLAEKKIRYAEIVREMYQPEIDRAKQMEIEILKEKS